MMTPEQRLDRLELIGELMTCVGLKERRRRRETEDKIAILVNMQIKNEERFAKNEERFAWLAESQAHTDRRLNALIDIVREGRNGKS